MNKQEQIKFVEDNYPLYTNHISNRRIRHDFFSDITTELQAYLLGFYAADGNINEKRKTLRIHLQKRDSELVYLYKDVISPDARTFTVQEHKTTGRNGKEITAHESFGVDITSTTLCNDLVKLGIGYNKSYSDLHIPQLPLDLKLAFIRGYFDGDGCFTAGLRKEIGKNDRITMSFTIISKSPVILTEMIELFSKQYNLTINLNYIKRDDLYRLTTSSKKVIKELYNILYKDANFYLSRKKNKMDHFVNTEVTQLIAEYRNAQEVNVNESNNPPTSLEHPKQDENIC